MYFLYIVKKVYREDGSFWIAETKEYEGSLTDCEVYIKKHPIESFYLKSWREGWYDIRKFIC